MTTYTGIYHNLIQEHSTFWLEDGSIIVATNSKESKSSMTTILFKIHKSILSMHSKIFRDLLSTPVDEIDKQSTNKADVKIQPQVIATQQVYEGLSVIEVRDVADDWAGILQVMYGDAFMISSELYDSQLELKLLGPMKIAKKYGMDNIHQHLSSLVEAQWPQTLTEWDTYQATRKEKPELFLDAAAAVVLASEHNIKRVLPVAFYLLSLADFSQEYGSAVVSKGLETKCSPCLPLTRWSQLRHKHFRKLMAGKERISLEIKRLEGLNYRCNSYCHGCSQYKPVNYQLQLNHRADVLTSLGPESAPSCIKWVVEEQRKKFWRELPIFFDISGIDDWI